MVFSTLEINRFTVHKIVSKRDLKNDKDKEPYAEKCEDFCNLEDIDGISELEDRILKATNQSKRFFELELERSDKTSFFTLGSVLYKSSRESYLELANKIADLAASKHDKGYIPGGLLIVLEAIIDRLPCIIIVKAEKSNAFSLNGSNIELVKNVFLSSDKALYKLGFLLKTDNKNNGVKSFKYYVYDDNFSSVKDDLATYFYSDFLGYSTTNNSKIQTNNLYNFLKEFTISNLPSFDDQNYILNAIDQDIMKKSKTILKPEDYKELFPKELHESYDSKITEKLPTAIIKDATVLTDIQTKRIRINESVLIVAKNGISNDIIIGDSDSEKFQEEKLLKIESGKRFISVMVPMPIINDTTKDTKLAPKRRKKRDI